MGRQETETASMVRIVAALKRQAGAASIASMFHPSPKGKAPITTGELPDPEPDPTPDGVTVQFNSDGPPNAATENAETIAFDGDNVDPESIAAMT